MVLWILQEWYQLVCTGRYCPLYSVQKDSANLSCNVTGIWEDVRLAEKRHSVLML
jgi:hypothetical protein